MEKARLCAKVCPQNLGKNVISEVKFVEWKLYTSFTTEKIFVVQRTTLSLANLKHLNEKMASNSNPAFTKRNF